MGNNKQSMRLYTDQQMRNAIKMARNGARSEDNIIDSLNFIKPYIELPSDEDICKEAHSFYKLELQYKAFIQGAKSLRDKIGGNK